MATDILNAAPVDMRILGKQDDIGAFRAALRDWLFEVTPVFNMQRMTAASEEEGVEIQRAWMAEREKVGLGQPHWPREFGGADLSLTHQIVRAD
jgi:alkylation response protein AidB-like acyl-CoA dehydrogenase